MGRNSRKDRKVLLVAGFVFIKNKFMKKLSLILTVLLWINFNSPIANATSGACSSHGGVNCNSQQVDGTVYCNDGWTGSGVQYEYMEMCDESHNYCNNYSSSCEYFDLQKFIETRDKAYVNLQNEIEEYKKNANIPAFRDYLNILYIQSGRINIRYIDYACNCTRIDPILNYYGNPAHGSSNISNEIKEEVFCILDGTCISVTDDEKGNDCPISSTPITRISIADGNKYIECLSQADICMKVYGSDSYHTGEYNNQGKLICGCDEDFTLVESSNRYICKPQPKTAYLNGITLPGATDINDLAVISNKINKKTTICEDGYNNFIGSCIKIPENAHAVKSNTDAWLCDDGYQEFNNSCIKENEIDEVAVKNDDVIINTVSTSDETITAEVNKINNEQKEENKITNFFNKIFNHIKNWFK